MMSKLVRLINTDGSDFYINPDEVIAVISSGCNTNESTLKTHAGQLYAIGTVEEVYSLLNKSNIEFPKELEFVTYDGKLYNSVLGRNCGLCIFAKSNEACVEMGKHCNGKAIHFVETTNNSI